MTRRKTDSLRYRFDMWIKYSPEQAILLTLLASAALLVWLYTLAPLFM